MTINVAYIQNSKIEPTFPGAWPSKIKWQSVIVTFKGTYRARDGVITVSAKDKII